MTLKKSKLTGSYKKYYSILKSIFPGSKMERKRYLSHFKTIFVEYSIDFPDISYENLEKEFGTPKDTIINYYLETDSAELLQQLRLKRKIQFIYIICILLLFSFSTYESVKMYQNYLNSNAATINYETDTITED